MDQLLMYFCFVSLCFVLFPSGLINVHGAFLTERKTSEEKKHQAALLSFISCLNWRKFSCSRRRSASTLSNRDQEKVWKRENTVVCGTTMPLHHIQLLLLHMFVFSRLTPLMRLSCLCVGGLRRLLMETGSFAIV